MAKIFTQAIRLFCSKCEHLWTDEILCNVAISVWVAHVRTLRCPKCGAGNEEDALAFVTDEAAILERLKKKKDVPP